ncbi:MAG: hypothetical protein ACQEVA_20280 [Myxococcota bacterium]
MVATSLISISPPDQPLHRDLLDAPGGFAWWYADMVDERGNGLVLIWSFGLPFLPGYADSARRGKAQRPGDRPSLNLSTYREGELDFYLLQEFDPADVTWAEDGETWSFGDNRLTSRIEDGKRIMRAELSTDIPGTDGVLEGTIEIAGTPRQPFGGETRIEGLPEHDWTPLTVLADGRAELAFPDGTDWQCEGRAYHDRNGGDVPLHDVGIDHWIWGRAPLEDRELIYYLLWPAPDAAPVALGMEIGTNGETTVHEQLEVDRGSASRNMGGLRWWRDLELCLGGELWLRVTHQWVVDSGPFYMRYLTRASAPDGHTVTGVGELCEPDRIDLGRHRPLVRMRVHHPQGQNSMWLPLFSGPRQGRVSRLLKSFLPG